MARRIYESPYGGPGHNMIQIDTTYSLDTVIVSKINADSFTYDSKKNYYYFSDRSFRYADSNKYQYYFSAGHGAIFCNAVFNTPADSLTISYFQSSASSSGSGYSKDQILFQSKKQ